MAVTFPNSPTLNQSYTAENGLIYIWDGQKWKTQAVATALWTDAVIAAYAASLPSDD